MEYNGNNGKCNNCNLDIPYPKIEVTNCDPITAKNIYKAYAGSISELGAISEYSYQTLLFEEPFPSAADLLDCISITEMKHFHMLGEIIVACGLNPVINFGMVNIKAKTGSRLPKVDVSRLRNAIMSNISAETKAIEDYEKLISMSKDDGINAVIRRIILDEKHHIELFTELLK